MSLVLHDMTSSVKVDGGHVVNSTTGVSTPVQWDYSPKSMDGADGATSNGGTCDGAVHSVISELNGDCSTDDTASCSLAHQAIIKQVTHSSLRQY